MPLHEAATVVVGPTKVLKSHDDTLELKILSLIQKNPRINQRELSDQLATSLSTIKRVMTGMIQANVLTRKGGKRYGHWEIEVKE